ncbi:class A beta-lactamase-related serine hydrolase [Tsuneonella sp. YG55]|uniref:Class A beta-lactamase-related serine hydrolase n=1 Tax=Tsuneonella litorea TaxID=2976475 RepID=A0A9X3AKC2_9SPHN|nr:class A beta-lactamase-related serine hydrolase [Tsuneonella litorea]MCT2558169.1 class A beta-lactamase-related serine hydrolase [Tsuneonella litorea]
MAKRFLFLIPLLALQATVSAAQDVSTVQQQTSAVQRAAEGVVAVWRGEVSAQMVFAPAFLAAVPEQQLAALKTQLEGQFGPFVGLEAVEPTSVDSATVRLRFERATIAGPMTLARDGKVAGLLLNDIKPAGDSIASIGAELADLPGKISVVYAPLDPAKPSIVAVNPGSHMAIGSTFKLYVLSALAHEIAHGARRWDDVVTLEARSFPSGRLQNWPASAPLTLHTLASMMISESDNTATDQLIRTLGRAAIQEEVKASGHTAPERMFPFLTTMELFALKGDAASARAFVNAPKERQRTLVEELAQRIDRDPASVVPPAFSEPKMIESLEWFASAEDLRRLMARIVALEDPTARQIMAVNPAMPAARRGDWRYVGYKGGSEPGVLNMSWLLQDRAGDWRVLAMSWNDPASSLDLTKFELLSQRLLAASPP